MNTEQYLLDKGVTMDLALSFVLNNLEQPQIIYAVAREFGLSSSMLADILRPVLPEVDAAMVEAFFTSQGFDGSALRDGTDDVIDDIDGGNDGIDDGIDDVDGLPILSPELSMLVNLVAFNDNSGVLSTASLRSAIIELTGEDIYNTAFDPRLIYGAEDGVFTASEVGVPGFPSFEATQENVESLVFGSVINALRAIDAEEVQDLALFMAANEAALSDEDSDAWQVLEEKTIQALQDPAATPFLTDEQLAEAIVEGGTMFVEVVGSGDASLLDGLFLGFV